jgi:glycosyltransferase involved in cell wall biosynthesis
MEWERWAALHASLVIVPKAETAQIVVERYGASMERVLVIPDVIHEEYPSLPDPAHARQQLGLSADDRVVLFAGELSWAAGADILLEAIPTVCRDQHTVQFVLAGDGPMRHDLQQQAHATGVAHRCRFLGDVFSEHFESVLLAASFVVIPARTWQDEGLAKLAISYGKPVLTTQQAQIYSVHHGQTGLVTHDNPGSIVWGIKELLANPLRGSMVHYLAKRKAAHCYTLDRVAVEHYLAFAGVLGKLQGAAVA